MLKRRWITAAALAVTLLSSRASFAELLVVVPAAAREVAALIQAGAFTETMLATLPSLAKAPEAMETFRYLIQARGDLSLEEQQSITMSLSEELLNRVNRDLVKLPRAKNDDVGDLALDVLSAADLEGRVRYLGLFSSSRLILGHLLQMRNLLSQGYYKIHHLSSQLGVIDQIVEAKGFQSLAKPASTELELDVASQLTEATGPLVREMARQIQKVRAEIGVYEVSQVAVDTRSSRSGFWDFLKKPKLEELDPYSWVEFNLKDGSRITGRLPSIEKGQVVIANADGEYVTIEKNQIESFTVWFSPRALDEGTVVELTTTDGTRHLGKYVREDSEKVFLEIHGEPLAVEKSYINPRYSRLILPPLKIGTPVFVFRTSGFVERVEIHSVNRDLVQVAVRVGDQVKFKPFSQSQLIEVNRTYMDVFKTEYSRRTREYTRVLRAEDMGDSNFRSFPLAKYQFEKEAAEAFFAAEEAVFKLPYVPDEAQAAFAVRKAQRALASEEVKLADARRILGAERARLERVQADKVAKQLADKEREERARRLYQLHKTLYKSDAAYTELFDRFLSESPYRSKFQYAAPELHPVLEARATLFAIEQAAKELNLVLPE